MIRDLFILGLNYWSPTSRYTLAAGMGPAVWQIPPLAALEEGGRLKHPEAAMTVLTFPLWDRIEAALTADLWLADAKVKLYTNDISPDWETAIADLTEATFDGYVGKDLVETAITFADGSGNFVTQYPSVAFQPTGSATPNEIFGYWVESLALGVGLRALWIVRFAEPVQLNGPEDALIVEPRLIIGQPSVD